MEDLGEARSASPHGVGDSVRNLDDGEAASSAGEQSPSLVDTARALFDDIEALVDDGRTYLDAEISYQKTRISFVSDRLKKTLVYVVAATVLGLVAAIGLTVGLIIALTPLITAWGATALVVGVLLIIAYILLRRASGTWSSATRVFGSDQAEDTSGAADGGRP